MPFFCVKRPYQHQLVDEVVLRAASEEALEPHLESQRQGEAGVDVFVEEVVHVRLVHASHRSALLVVEVLPLVAVAVGGTAHGKIIISEVLCVYMRFSRTKV